MDDFPELVLDVECPPEYLGFYKNVLPSLSLPICSVSKKATNLEAP